MRPVVGGNLHFFLVEDCGNCVKDLWFCKLYLVHGQGAHKIPI